MDRKEIGFLHPGLMGVSLAASSKNSGHTAYWVSSGRSAETRERAVSQDLAVLNSIEEMCERCSIIISVCPPHAALSVAEEVIGCSYNGLYADVNAISPERTKKIGGLIESSGAEFVDGGIIGGPAWKPNSTWLYLSGRSADKVASCFAEGPLETEVIGDAIGKASALKMCFAANTKGTTALLCAVVAAAEGLGVREELERQWSRNGSSYAADVMTRIVNVTAKAWRFSGEMEEIASTLAGAGVTDGFHLGAAEMYNRIAKFKGAEPLPEIDEVINALLKR